MPAPTVTSPLGTSSDRIPASLSRCTSTPSVTAIPVNECPEPTALTRSPWATAARMSSASSSMLPGWVCRTGCASSVPAQLVQLESRGMRPDYRFLAMDPDARRTRAAVTAAFAAQGLGFAVLLTHLPAFKDKYGVGDTFVTIILFMVSVLAGGGTALATWLSAQRGSGLALRVSLATIGVALAVVAVAPGVPLLVAGFVIYGVGVGGVDAAMNMQAVALEHRYGRSILTSFHSAWSAAGIVGALATYVTEDTDDLADPGAALRGRGDPGHRGRRRRPAGHGDQLGGRPPRPDAPGPTPPIVAVAAGAAAGRGVVCFYVADSGTSSWSSIYLHDVLHTTTGVAALAYGFYTGRLPGLPAGRRPRRTPRGRAARRARRRAARGPRPAPRWSSPRTPRSPSPASRCWAWASAWSRRSPSRQPGSCRRATPTRSWPRSTSSTTSASSWAASWSASSVRPGCCGPGFVVPLVLTLVIIALAPAFHPTVRAAQRRGRPVSQLRAQFERLERATADLDPPFAVVDLDAFDRNAHDLARRATGVPIRVASKSVRVPRAGRPSRCGTRAFRAS